MKHSVRLTALGVALLGLALSRPLHGRSNKAPIPLPTETPLLKISVSEPSLVTLTRIDLLNQGIDVSRFDPNHLQLVHRGGSVALRWLGDGDSEFELDESIQFFAEAFDGSRYEKQFVSENVYWLWSGAAATQQVLSQSAPPHGGNATRTHRATQSVEPENDFFSGWTDQWSTFPNEPDAWYWMRFPEAGSGLDETRAVLTIDLPHPAPIGAEASLTTEWFSRARATSPGAVENAVAVRLNDAAVAHLDWNGRRSINLHQTIPTGALQNGANLLTVTLTTPDVLYLNRATIAFDQRLVLDSAALSFSVDRAGDILVDVGSTPLGNLQLWEVSDPYQPVHIELTNQNRTIQGLRFSHDAAVSTRYLLFNTEKADALPRLAVRQFDPPPTDADWLAITHPILAAPAARLAAHRTNSDDLHSAVVPINQVIDQFGYGLPLPQTISDYLRWIAQSAGRSPRYLVLFGDATINPRQLDCRWSCTNTGWDSSEATLLLTDLRFVDRFQGLIPTDQTLGMLGDDLLPDVMIGRIAARTREEADAAVDKIIFYENAASVQNHADKSVLFLADSSDAAGDFCLQNRRTAALLPWSMRRNAYCLPTDPTPADLARINASLYGQINGHGVYVLNYRGHGGVQHWGSGDILLSVAEASSTLGAWRNAVPTVILSADCLDGHFAWPGLPSISETLLTLPNAGSAAHWSSTGLGADHEHALMHENFYLAFQESEVDTIGEAIRFAQAAYLKSGAHPSPLYSFTLQGDPALKFDWVRYSGLFLPLISGEN